MRVIFGVVVNSIYFDFVLRIVMYFYGFGEIEVIGVGGSVLDFIFFGI